MKDLIQSFQFRKKALALADGFIIAIAALITDYFLPVSRKELTAMLLMTVICSFFALFISGAYSKLWRYFRLKDYLSCVIGILVGVLCSAVFILAMNGTFPLGFALVHAAISIIGICLFRFIFKTTFIQLTQFRESNPQYRRTMIIGGGQSCAMLLKEIHNAQASDDPEKQSTAQYAPVCIIDDDDAKIGTEVEGVLVVGKTQDIHKFVLEYEIEQIIFAIPSCMQEDRQRILHICSETNLPVKVLPFIGSLIFDEEHPTFLHQIRDIKMEDLLGRSAVKFDNLEISRFIRNKVCMVTGGGGSIGSELVRQIAKYSPAQIIIVDIYENNAYEIEQELLMEYGDSLNLVTLIASVRDYHRMSRIYTEYKPQIVFHAAAHKHVPLMEASPMEAIKNNVIGTFNVATLAQFHNTEKFVMISTDKAVNPTNVMGASKRCCEMIVQYLAQQHDGTTEFITTRFGNVLGSNGSVIQVFKRQLEQGKPLTVTHPDIIRYFMTIPEAVSLVLEAAAIAHGGEIFVLDMGKPVRIVTLAENLIRMYGKVPYQDVPIEFIGLRPGEKIKEELLMDEEGLTKTKNELIFIGQQLEIDEDAFPLQLKMLQDAARQDDAALTVQALHEMVPTFTTAEEFNQKILSAS